MVLIAGLTALSRLPHTLSDLNSKAAQNDKYTAVGKQLASADSLDIDNGVAGAAMSVLPRDATFTVVPPTTTFARLNEVAPLTIEALSPYFRYLLLPRREVAPEQAEWVICYGCDQRLLRGHTRWVWTDENGLAIGRMR